VRLVAIDGSTIRFAGVDMLDGTALVDIKPYVGRRILLALISAITLLLGGAVTTRASAHNAPGRFVVKGDVENRLKLHVSDLADLPQQTPTVTFLAGTTPQTHTYTGVLLLDVLKKAVPKFDPAIKNDNLRHYVVVTGSDGYRVVVAWGEFDPFFEGKQILLAETEDGVSLQDAGPRLVVPDDSRGGRYVTNVVTVRLSPVR
jgi:hypothetical protein